MRLRNIPGAEEAILNSEYCIKNPEEQKGHWQDCFDKVQPLHIEIGMGKGRFIMDMAALHPDINYIGIERYSSVLLRALQKMELNPLPNIKYIRRERYAGSMSRSFYVGENMKEEDIHAKYENGILTLDVPKEQKKAVPEKRYIAIEG